MTTENTVISCNWFMKFLNSLSPLKEQVACLCEGIYLEM